MAGCSSSPYTRKDSVSKVVSEIGTKAGVKVDSKRTADPGTPKSNTPALTTSAGHSASGGRPGSCLRS